MDMTVYLRRGFYFLTGFAITTSVVLISQPAKAEKMSGIGGLDRALNNKCLNLVSHTQVDHLIQNNDYPTLLSVGDKIAFNLIQVLMPKIFEIDGLGAREAAVKSIEKLVFQAQQPMYKSGVASGTATDNYSTSLQEKIQFGHWGTPYEFWQKFGLGEAYTKRFASDKNFFDSALSLVQIYKDLMRRSLDRNLYGQLKLRNIGAEAQFQEGSGQVGTLLMLNQKEIQKIPDGTMLWSQDGQRIWKGSDEANQKIALASESGARAWGIRIGENFEVMTKWDFVTVAPVEEEGVTFFKDARGQRIDMVVLAQSEEAGYRANMQFLRLEKLKAEGRVFSIKVGDKEVYPAFQFEDTLSLRVRPSMAKILEKVPVAARGKPLLTWMMAQNVFLGSQTPIEILNIKPAAVAEAADQFFGQDN